MDNQTPSSHGYFMPSEWHLHGGTWLSWPKNPDTFPPKILGAVENLYIEMASSLSLNEKVNILVDNANAKEKALTQLEYAGAKEESILFHLIKSADVWIRDYGPTFLLNKKSGQPACIKWNFNAWGNKYSDLLPDNEAGEKIVQSLKIPIFRPNIVMEGGSFDVDGDGRLLTTKQCLLNKNRNPNLVIGEIEGYLKNYLNAKEIIWLDSGIEGDDTDGHVDDFARFFGKGKVLCASDKNSADANSNSKVLSNNKKILLSSGNLEVVDLPMPKPIFEKSEKRFLPASYANFYIANKFVFLPVFGDKQDKNAIEILSSCFSDREIIPLRANELVYGYGGIHCVSQQVPKGE